MNKKITLSLKLKLTLVINLLLALILLFVFFYFPQKFEKERILSLQEKANSIAEIAAYGVSAGSYFEDSEGSNEEIETLLTNESIRYVVIIKDDSIFYEHNVFIAQLNDYKDVQLETISQKWEIMKCNAPIILSDKKIGDVYLGFSLSPVYEKINEIRISIGKISLILFLVGAILIYLIGGIFTKPLTTIVKVVNNITDGDLSQRIENRSNDEIGVLSNSFNEMVEKISESKNETEKINRELENRVLERTQELEGVLRTLQKENKDRKKAESEISKSLHEKEVLLKEIHHRVKNNLQIVSSLFFFQSKQITDPVMLEMFRDGQNRVKSMALIHEKLYQASDLANIDFKEYVKKLTNFLFQSYGINQSKFKLKNNVQQVKLGVDTAVPCGLIINELISNSFKHGFSEAEQGEIKIDMGYDVNDKLILKISDNGKGIPKDLIIEESESLGLRLVLNLTTQLNGKVEFLNNGGTTVRIEFPNPLLKKVN